MNSKLEDNQTTNLNQQSKSDIFNQNITNDNNKRRLSFFSQNALINKKLFLAESRKQVTFFILLYINKKILIF